MSALPPLPAPTVAGLARGLHRGEYSSVELTRACLERIAAGQPELNAFVTVTAEGAETLCSSKAQYLRSPKGSHKKSQL